MEKVLYNLFVVFKVEEKKLFINVKTFLSSFWFF